MEKEYCQRCLPERFVKAMGFIPLPEPSKTGDSRYEEQRILLCQEHYFDAKKDCYYVVPFDRDDDPVDSFLTRVNEKHKRIRGSLRMKFGSKNRLEKEVKDDPEPTSLRTYVEPNKITRSQRQNNKNYNHRVHYPEDTRTTCGLPVLSTATSTEIDDLTCKNCISLLSAAELKREPDFLDPLLTR